MTHSAQLSSLLQKHMGLITNISWPSVPINLELQKLMDFTNSSAFLVLSTVQFALYYFSILAILESPVIVRSISEDDAQFN